MLYLVAIIILAILICAGLKWCNRRTCDITDTCHDVFDPAEGDKETADTDYEEEPVEEKVTKKVAKKRTTKKTKK